MAGTTSHLLKRLEETADFQSYLQENRKHLAQGSVAMYLCRKCAEKELVHEQVIMAAGLDRSYGHQIFRGIRQASRDKLLLLAFAMGLTLEETQRMLLLARKPQLHPRLLRDDVVLFSLLRGLSLEHTQEMLIELGAPVLGEDTL